MAGFHDDKPYLAYIDHQGMYLEDKSFTTGFASYVCKPTIMNNLKPDTTEEEAKTIIKECFKNLFYRDARASDIIQICIIDKNGCRIEQPFKVETKWDYEGYAKRANEKLYNQ